MTGKTLLERYTAKADPVVPMSMPGDGDMADDLGSFGWLRGVRDRAMSLELRRKDGTILAISYGFIERAEFDPSEGITVYAGAQKLRIKGRHLNAEVRSGVRLFEGISRHRVPWIQEADRQTAIQADPTGTIIDLIEW